MAMHMKAISTTVWTTLVATLVLTGCTSTPPTNHLAEFRSEIEAVVEQYHDEPDMLRSAIGSVDNRGIPTARIEQQATLAGLAMEHHPAEFLAEAESLSDLLRGRPLHRISRPVQVVAYLGRYVKGEGTPYASGTVKTMIHNWCGDPVERAETLLTGGSARERVELDFQYNLGAACYMNVRGEQDRAARYMVRAYLALSQRPELETVLIDADVQGGEISDAIRVFHHRMRQRGVDLELPLRLE